MKDPRLARQLTILTLAYRAQQMPGETIEKMVEIDVSEVDTMRSLQAEVRLYGDMMTAAKELVSRGREADWEVNEEDREEIAAFLTEAEARELGINHATED